ncbi:hypothetical protein B0T13DRAFT_50115 [Neurospora crassa]|nr:hypothetical protein B0T13DRAFT_50115 [Neurospora crassa]
MCPHSARSPHFSLVCPRWQERRLPGTFINSIHVPCSKLRCLDDCARDSRRMSSDTEMRRIGKVLRTKSSLALPSARVAHSLHSTSPPLPLRPPSPSRLRCYDPTRIHLCKLDQIEPTVQPGSIRRKKSRRERSMARVHERRYIKTAFPGFFRYWLFSHQPTDTINQYLLATSTVATLCSQRSTPVLVTVRHTCWRSPRAVMTMTSPKMVTSPMMANLPPRPPTKSNFLTPRISNPSSQMVHRSPPNKERTRGGTGKPISTERQQDSRARMSLKNICTLIRPRNQELCRPKTRPESQMHCRRTPQPKKKRTLKHSDS